VRFEVLNAGCAGYSSYQGLQRFREEVEEFQPDVVFVSFGWNDLAKAMGMEDNAFVPPRALKLQRLLLHYKFYLCAQYYLKIYWKSRQKSKPKPPSLGYVARVSEGNYVANLKGFLATGKENGAGVILLTRPFSMPGDTSAHQSYWKENMPVYNQNLIRFAEENGVPFVDVYGHFETRPELFVDSCHFSEDGYKEMARLLRKKLEGLGYLRPSG